MNILEEVLENMTVDEIYNIYKGYREQNYLEEAILLRTAYIKKVVQEANPVDWDSNLKFLIAEESIDLTTNQNATLRCKTEKRRSNDFITGMNALLAGKLMKRDMIPLNMGALYGISRAEFLFIKTSSFERLVLIVSVALYMGKKEEKKTPFLNLLHYMKINFNEFRSIGICLDTNLSIVNIESIVEDELRELENLGSEDLASQGHLRDKFITLFLYNWWMGNMDSTRYFLLKALKMTSDQSAVFNSLSFINRELAEVNE